jgi:quinol monooxygenase YgiN
MPNMVIAEFTAAPGKTDELVGFLGAALPDTRKFDGCLSLDVQLDRASDTIVMIENWQSQEHYDRYLGWRMETGMVDEMGGLLLGGIEGMTIRKLEQLDI